MIRQIELIERLKAYNPDINEDFLNRAYVFSMEAHGSQVRASGAPYFSHPLEVAGILVELHLDSNSIVTALLHDTVEDTLVTLDEIEKQFGPEVAKLVDGVTKLSRLELQSEQTKQAENFRKLVLAMSSDIRVLLVKLADRLHNMRTLHFIESEEKRKRIARETMEIYAPLAERIGMQRLKDELEDLAFAQLNPEAYTSICKRLTFLHEASQNTVDPIVKELETVFKDAGLNVTINGREKMPYSIWRKMQRKNITFEQLPDIIAFRMIVANIAECYQALGVVHGHYPVVPGRFKDYISTPKQNGYRSIHTTVIGPFNHRIEIQIRTQDMHIISEYGVAAHWQYKQGEPLHDGKQYAWLRGLLDILEHTAGPEEFLEHTKLEMFQDQVFCFTPKGDLISLPKGATPIDFAYAVHSQIGDHSVAAKINGRMMPLRSILNNGDQVEIISSKTQTPSASWERFAVTGKARARIRRFVRSQQREQFLELGRSLLEKAFQVAGIEYSEEKLTAAVSHFKQSNIEELHVAVGSGLIAAHDVVKTIYPDHKIIPSAPEIIAPKTPKEEKTFLSFKGLIPGMAVHYAGCCHPLPGDRISGIVTSGKGVTIHTNSCGVLAKFTDPERILDLTWEDGLISDNYHVGRLKLTVANQPGSLASLSAVMGKCEANIANIRMTNRASDFFDMFIDVEVKNVQHLESVIAALRPLSVVSFVERI